MPVQTQPVPILLERLIQVGCTSTFHLRIDLYCFTLQHLICCQLYLLNELTPMTCIHQWHNLFVLNCLKKDCVSIVFVLLAYTLALFHLHILNNNWHADRKGIPDSAASWH